MPNASQGSSSARGAQPSHGPQLTPLTSHGPRRSSRPSSTHSQTLDRGIRVLEVLSESAAPLSVVALAETLEVHRSVAYRIVRTFEEHGLVERDRIGRIRLAPRMATLAHGVARDVQAVALPELTAIANTFGVTAFLTVLDRDEVITLVSVEARAGHGLPTHRPGTRHPVNAGAPGIAIQTQLSRLELERLRRRGLALAPEVIERAVANGFAVSHDEVVRGLSSVAVPLILAGRPPAALAVVQSVASPRTPQLPVGKRLRRAAHVIATELG